MLQIYETKQKYKIMEEKNITAQESISIITSMINNTRKRLHLGDGNILLLWGYLTVAVAALISILLIVTHNSVCNWLWFLIMIIGGTVTPHMARRQESAAGARTHLDAIGNGIWSAIGYISLVMIAVCLFFMLFLAKDCWEIMLLFPLIFVGFAETIQGIVIREKSLMVGGSVGMVCGIITLACIATDTPLALHWFMPMFIFAFVAMMIIPGHIINHKAQSQK